MHFTVVTLLLVGHVSELNYMNLNLDKKYNYDLSFRDS